MQVYCPPGCAMATAWQLCLAGDALSGCLTFNHILLNPTKTLFIWLGSHRRLARVDWCLKPFLILSSVTLSVTLGSSLTKNLTNAHSNHLTVVATISFACCTLFLVPYLLM